MNAKTKGRITLVFDVGTNTDIKKDEFDKLVEEESVRAEMALNQGNLRWHLQEVRHS